MTFLLTGASGFLGESLADLLVKDGHQVVLLSRQATIRPRGVSLQRVVADISNGESLKAARATLPKVDTIVHLAAAVPRTKDSDDLNTMVRSNVVGTANLLEIFGEDLKSFVYASTAEVYGLPNESQPIKETLLPTPLSYYGVSKLAGELLCNAYAAHHQVVMTNLRFSVLYGPGDRINRAIPNFIKKAINGENLEVYGGEELRDYLHVSDAVQATYLAAVKQVTGTFNIGTGTGISIKDTAQSIINAVNPNLKIKLLPREKKAVDIVLDVTQATNKLGFTARYAFPELIEEQIEWHRQN